MGHTLGHKLIVDSYSCPPCKGEGWKTVPGGDLCPICEGNCFLPRDPTKTLPCPLCRETTIGWKTVRGGDLCPRCEGSGWIRPAGVVAPQLIHVPARDLEQAARSGRELLGSLTGEALYVDPYMGPDTLTWLAFFRREVPVRFLTSRVQDPDGTLGIRLAAFREWFPNVEMRRLQGTDLHSRYVIAGNRIIQLGHSGQGAGRGESVVTDSGDAAHLHRQINDLRLEFEVKWGRGQPIPGEDGT